MPKEKRILIELDDKSNWLAELNSPETAAGYTVETNRVILLPEGDHKMFTFTNAVMHYASDATPAEHIHHSGYETFFIRSGSLDYYSMGKYCSLKKDDIVHQPPHISHGMIFHEDVKYPGVYQDWSLFDDLEDYFDLMKRDPQTAQSLDTRQVFMPASPGATDVSQFGAYINVKADPEEMYAVRNPSRPLHQFSFSGVTMKMLIGRWETGGVREMWLAEMKSGYKLEWEGAPPLPELFYVTKGKVRFTVYGEEYIAHEECLVKIPKYAPRSLEALTDAEVYDLAGLPLWYEFFHDYQGIHDLKPELLNDGETLSNLKKRTGVHIKLGDGNNAS